MFIALLYFDANFTKISLLRIPFRSVLFFFFYYNKTQSVYGIHCKIKIYSIINVLLISIYQSDGGSTVNIVCIVKL